MTKKRTWTVEEKEKIIKEAEANGVRKTLDGHNLSSSSFYTWKERYESQGLTGLITRQRIRDQEVPRLKNKLDKLQKDIMRLEEELEFYKELTGKLSIKDIRLLERITLIRKYNSKGIKLQVLLDICQVKRREYYGKSNDNRN